MIENEYSAFAEIWRGVHSAMAGGKTFSDASMTFVFDVLSEYPLSAIGQALKLHAKVSNFAPMPADVIKIINAHTGMRRLPADEAWAMMPIGEYDKGKNSPHTIEKTVVWTDEMAEAYKSASVFLDDGDKIAARMAFKSAYDRLCSDAELKHKPVVWRIVPGYDKEEAKLVLQSHVANGHISQDAANKVLMPPDLYDEVSAGKISQDDAMMMLPSPSNSGVIAGFVSGKLTEPPKNDANWKERWSEFSAVLKASKKIADEKEAREIEARNNRRFEFEANRQAQLKKVAERQGAVH